MSLNDLLKFGLFGLATGSLYGLVSLGVVVVYRASGVLNFAAGAVGSVGAYVCYWLRDDHGLAWQLALLLGIVAGAVLGGLTHVTVVRLPRRSSQVAKLIASLGTMSVILGSVPIIWGTEYRGQPTSMLPTELVTVLPDVRVPWEKLILIGCTLVMALVLRAVYSRSLFGLATSAVAENRRTAATGGLSASTIELTNFTIAGALSSGAAILLAPTVGLEVSALTLLVVPALAGALVGRFSSFALTLIGCMVIAVSQALLPITGFVTEHPNLKGLPAAVPVLVIVAVTVLRGSRHMRREEASVRLPMPGSGQLRPVAVGALVVGAGLLVAGLDPAWVSRLHITLAMGVVLLSVVVVTGYAGQLSLCQFALAGFGAWVAARLVAAQGVDVPLAVGAAIAATVLLGLIVALPALRARGVELAVATLGLSQMIFAVILNNSDLTGGFVGTRLERLHLFGIDIDPLTHPEAYGFFALTCFVLSALMVANLRRGRSGRRLLAVRSNERAAASLGVGVYGAKLYAFAVAAGLAALGGILLAFRNQQVLFLQFDVFGSIAAIENSVIGGLGLIGGAVVGAAISPGGLVPKLMSSVLAGNDWIPVLAGSAVILTVALHPDGLAAIHLPVIRPAHGPRTDEGVGDPGVSVSRPRRAPHETRYSLEVHDVSVRFDGLVALDGVSFSTRSGEILGVIGPNGAGKTTLLDVVTGFTSAHSGRVVFGGNQIDRWSPERRARAGLTRSFQGVELFDEMTVRENLLVASDDQSRVRYLIDLVRPGKPAPTAMMHEVITDFDLKHVLEMRPSDLDQGTRRLVGIARAIAADPAVLFLDEPAAGLSSDETQRLGDLLRELVSRRGLSIVLVEHDVPLVMSLCDRILVLDFGCPIASGTPDEVRHDPAVISAYLGDQPADTYSSVDAEAVQ